MATVIRLIWVCWLTLALSVSSLAQTETNDPDTAQIRPEIPNFWNSAAPPPAPQQVVRQIRFVTSDDFPPFNFLDADDNLIGFNVDLARAMCELLEAQCTMAIRPFGEVADMVRQGNADVAIAGLAASSHADLLFSSTYLSLPGRFVRRQDRVLEAYPEALDAITVGVVAASQHEAFLRRYFPRSTLRTYPSPSAMRAALRAGEVAIVFDDALTASFWLAGEGSAGCCQFQGGPYLSDTHFGTGLQLALANSNEPMRTAVEFALYRTFATGRYAEIYLRYFPVSLF